MNVLSCLLFPNSIGRIETGTEPAMSDLRRMRTSSYHSPWVVPRHGPRHSKGGLNRLGARGSLTVIDLREHGQDRKHDHSAVRLTQGGPPAVRQAGRTTSCPSHGLHEVTAASGRCSLSRLPGSRS